MVYLTDNQIAGLERINEAFNRLRKNHSVSAFKHLGFGATDKQIETMTLSDGKYFGELNSNNQEHGKGVMIFNDRKKIIFAESKNGKHVTSNYITIFEDGDIHVGEIYFKGGR